MFNTTITNLVKKVLFNSSSKSEISTIPNIKGNAKGKHSVGLTNKEMEELLLESRMKRYGITRELLLEAALFNVDWDFQKNGVSGLEEAIEKARKIEKEATCYMYQEYSESRI